MKDESWAIALRVAVSISSWIAFPVIGGLFLGKWLDQKFGTGPWLFLITIGFCFLVSIYGLVTEAQKEFKKIEKEHLEKTPQNNQDNKNNQAIKNNLIKK